MVFQASFCTIYRNGHGCFSYREPTRARSRVYALLRRIGCLAVVWTAILSSGISNPRQVVNPPKYAVHCRQGLDYLKILARLRNPWRCFPENLPSSIISEHSILRCSHPLASSIDHHRSDPLFATASSLVQVWDETKFVEHMQ